MACVLFDVDGTLFDNPSSERRFIAFLLRRRKIGVRQLNAAMTFYARALPRFGRHAARKNKAYLYGLSVAEISVLAETFVHKELGPLLRPVMRARIEEHRKRNDDITLLTGTPDFIAAPIARMLGIEHWRATECAVADGCFTAGPPLAHPLGTDKLLFAKQLCYVLGAEAGDCIAYADSIHDLPLLHWAGTAIAVHPDRQLAAAARRHDWTIIKGSATTSPFGTTSVPVQKNLLP